MDLFSLVARLTLDKSDYDAGIGDAQSSAKGFASKLGSGLKTAAKVGTAALAAVGTAAAAATTALVKGAGEAAAYGDNIDKASQKLGISAEAYQEWDAVLQHSGTSIDSMSIGMKTLATQAQSGSDAFKKLGISQKQAAKMSREDLFEATITALQNVSNENERAALAQELFGRSAMELGPLLNTSAEDTQAMRDRVHELGGVMSDEAVKAAAAYQDSLQDMQTAIDGTKRSLISEFLPSLTTVMDGVTELFTTGGTEKIGEGVGQFTTKLAEIIPKVLEIGSDIILSISSAVTENLPTLIESAAQMVLTLGEGLIKQLPDIVEAGLEVIVSLAKGIADALPELIPTIVDVVLKIADILTDPDNLSEIIDAAIGIVLALIDGIVDALPKLIEKGPEIIENIATGIVDNLPKLLEAGLEVIVSLAEGIVDALPELIPTIVDVVLKIADILTDSDNLSEIIDAAMEIMLALIDGIVDALPKLVEKGPEIIEKIVTGIVDNFPKILEAGGKIIGELAQGILDCIEEIREAIGSVGQTIIDGIGDLVDSAAQWGKDMIDNFIGGINGMWESARQAVSGFAGRIKSFLGFSEPEEGPLSDFHTYAPDMMELFAKGIRENQGIVDDAIAGAFNFRPTIAAGMDTGEEIIVPRGGAEAPRNIIIPLYIDGREFARAEVPYIEAEQQRVGLRLSGR